jgi:KilA-N domain
MQGYCSTILPLKRENSKFGQSKLRMAAKQRIIEVAGTTIAVIAVGEEDYISLTDMVKNYPNNNVLIGNWLRSKNTIQYLGLWEQLHNPDFKLIEFDEFRITAGERTFSMSPKQWIEATGAIGIVSRSGRYGGTYAQKDIAFKFATWLSPEFELFLIKDYQQLKQWENSEAKQEWSIRRLFSKINYRLQTDAIEQHLLPLSNLPAEKHRIEYAQEADLLNIILFGMTAKEWKAANPDKVALGSNMREEASIVQLTILANMEALNAMLIKSKIPKERRAEKLAHYAKSQLEVLLKDLRLQNLSAQERLALHRKSKPLIAIPENKRP